MILTEGCKSRIGVGSALLSSEDSEIVPCDSSPHGLCTRLHGTRKICGTVQM